MCIQFLTADRQSQVMKSTERHFFQNTECTYHCIKKHILWIHFGENFIDIWGGADFDPYSSQSFVKFYEILWKLKFLKFFEKPKTPNKCKIWKSMYILIFQEHSLCYLLVIFVKTVLCLKLYYGTTILQIYFNNMILFATWEDNYLVFNLFCIMR
jgi:hypothetical protein